MKTTLFTHAAISSFLVASKAGRVKGQESRLKGQGSRVRGQELRVRGQGTKNSRVCRDIGSEVKCNNFNDGVTHCVWEGYFGLDVRCRSTFTKPPKGQRRNRPTSSPSESIAPSHHPNPSPASFKCDGYTDKASCNNVTPCVWEWVGKEGSCTGGDELMQVVSQ